MPNFPRQVIGSFEDIGKDIVREVTKLPTDIAGKALESLGTASSGQQGQKQGNMVFTGQSDATKPKDNWDSIDGVKDQKIKQAIARDALASLIHRPKQKEPSVWEKLQMDAEKKKELQNQQQVQAHAQQLPVSNSKRPRGDLYGLKAKRNPGEIGKNVKSD